MRRITILMSVLLAAGSLYAQADKTYQAEDNRQRGYYNRPWLRYEAETGKCQTNATVLPASTANANIQSEATNQVAVNLVNKGDYVEWTNEKAANAMTIRFSLPDNATSSIAGTGTTGNVGLYVNGQKVSVYQATRTTTGINESDNILLDSYWAWQYFTGRVNVAYETKSGSVLRMRFDEVILRTKNEIPAGATFKLVKEDENSNPYTIDFVELEQAQPVAFESIVGEKVKYTGDGGDLQTFVNDNVGKTVYLPEGKYNVPVRLAIPANTTLQGAGIFFTEVFFSAPFDASNYNKRGLTSNSSNVKVDGMYLNGTQNQRYFDRNQNKGPGKGFNGSFGSNSVISNVLVQHFECGAWLEGAKSLLMQHVRIRNNYADGTNIASASKDCTMEFMSYRNNGDDDMASWSRAGLAQNLTFRYNVSECNWRASGIGIFGGKGHQVHHCLVTDPIEGGIRIDAQYAGRAFDASEMMVLSDISIYNGGTVGNTSTWNTSAPAILFSMAGGKYDVQNVKIENVDLYDSKNSAIMFTSNVAARKFSNICLENINIHNAGTYGLYFKTGVKGSANYYNVNFEGCSVDIKNDAYPEDFTLYNEPCAADAVFVPASDGSFAVSAENGYVEVSGAAAGTEVAVYNMLGQKVSQKTASTEGTAAFSLNAGAYVVVSGNIRVKIVF
ncbi:MAG: right-handed parallel beta-helix repeat-containing protein [Bacteroidales bacterium]|nr:right-handed parallel beta-helix repeat-containing protein [Bacteroidales bacterium]